MGFQMVDREKFKIYDMEALGRSTTQQNAVAAEQKQEAAAQPLDGGVDMTSYLERMGRPIQVGVFISILRRLNPALIFQLAKGDPTKYGIYVPAYEMDLLTTRPVLSQLPTFICGMESGINLGGRINEGVMPEFSIVVNDDIILPDGDSIRKSKKFVKEIRGWRTVLAALHIEGLLSETQIERNFKISQGRDSSNWQNRMHSAITAVSGDK